MREAATVAGPLRVVLKDGVTLEVAAEVGGGTYVGETPTGDPPFYEVHFVDAQDEFIIVPQRQIERVERVDTGEEVEFGNPFVDEHPRQRALPIDDPELDVRFGSLLVAMANGDQAETRAAAEALGMDVPEDVTDVITWLHETPTTEDE